MTRCRPRWPPSRRWARTRPRSTCSPPRKTRTPAEPDGGRPHVLVIRPPGGKLTWLRALGSRRAAAITAILAFFTGFLITDGYTAYQQLLPELAGIQQCAAHVIRRCRAVTKLGPGSLQSWAGDVIEILREAHQATDEARARGEPAADAELLARLRAALRRGRRLRDHPQPAPRLARRQPPRLRTRLLAARPRRARSGCSPASPPSTGRTIWLHTAPLVVAGEYGGWRGVPVGCRAGGFSVAGGSDILPWCAGAPGFAVGVAAA